MASPGFKGGDKMVKVLNEIARKSVGNSQLRVGFLETEKYPDGTNVAQVAFWNEYGTIHAPPRPFFRRMIEAKSSKWGKALGKSLTSTHYDVPAALSLMGEGIKDQLTASIVGFASPGNAESTVKAKGFDKPLVDTGQMQRAVGYDVKDN